MKIMTQEELRDGMMNIMDYVDSFCRQNNINYTLSGGTLLGAVRHGGFIPWDDDMDIQIVRKDYDRFITLWNKSTHPYELISIESGNNKGFPFGKIHDPRTVTYIGKLERTGVYIDIFPVDGVLDMTDFNIRHDDVKKMYKKRSGIFARMQLLNGQLCLLNFVNWARSGFTFKSYKQHAIDINNRAKEFSDNICPFTYEMISGLRCKKPIPTEIFESYTKIKFENREYMAVSDYDTYLSLTFGDYMTLPPIDKRVQHGYIAYWK